MKASILHPDCQNLVIRDEKGKIVAKSTLYINREQGYGVFNNVEINHSIIDEEKIEKIYEKYMKAVNDFAHRYNELNVSKPLEIITIGYGNNKLFDKIINRCEKSDKIYGGINFSKYGCSDRCYEGMHRQS